MARRGKLCPVVRLALCFLLGVCLLYCPAARSQTGSTGGSWRGPWLGANSYVVNDLVSYNGSLYINTVATAPGTASSSQGTNLFDLNSIATNTVIVGKDGSATFIGGPESTGYVDLGGAATFITNIRMGLFPPFGVAFYDSGKAFVSGFDGTNLPYPYQTDNNALSPNQPINVPSGVRYVRFWYSPSYNQGTTDAAAIINAGSTLQTTYTPFGSGGTTTTTASAAPTDPTHWSILGNVATSAGLSFRGAYNPAASYAAGDITVYLGSSFIAVASSTGVLPIGASGSTASWSILAQAGSTGSAGTVGPAGPQGAVGPQGPQGTSGVTAGSFLAGRKFGVLGDSISSYLFSNAWQNVVIARTGASLTVQDARPGRALATAFECWGNPPVGGTLGPFDATYAFGSVGGHCGDTVLGISNGESFADSLANVDFEIIALGTNSQSNGLGALGDATNSGTFYGNLRWVVETYLAAKPTLRLVLVTPQFNNLASASVIQGYADAMVTYGRSVGVPVINMFELGGVNTITAGSLLQDGLHPSSFGFTNFYGPVIAQGLQRIY